MKVINGDFGKKKAEESEETPLLEKLATVCAQVVEDENEKGNFILIVESPDGTAQIATDMTASDVNLLLDLMKQQLISGTFDRGEIN